MKLKSKTKVDFNMKMICFYYEKIEEIGTREIAPNLCFQLKEEVEVAFSF